MMPRIFISGKYTAGTEQEFEDNINLAKKVSKYMFMNGISNYTPHLSTYKFEDLNDYNFFVDHHLSFLKEWATDLYLLPNWEDSYGSKKELNRAVDWNKRIWRPNSLEELVYNYKK